MNEALQSKRKEKERDTCCMFQLATTVIYRNTESDIGHKRKKRKLTKPPERERERAVVLQLKRSLKKQQDIHRLDAAGPGRPYENLPKILLCHLLIVSAHQPTLAMCTIFAPINSILSS